MTSILTGDASPALPSGNPGSRTTLSRTTLSRTHHSASRHRTPASTDVDVLRAMLEQQRDFRVEQLAQLHRPGPHGPLSSTDPEVFRSLSSGARAALRDVQSALWRMDEGSYGLCVSCGEPLEFARLEILPQVASCMPCQRGAATRSGAG